ncbi:hypothetical protein L1987_84792 [Smallanthus sonchifolius]|uniref:Uncharacterized protein n=1 Tax=Smallanthus sonchifolius TaxID=185202 RepID=A0ACB8XVA0_9ASTR|nr:hypothetical protein L1987_84792 [Smallanthus sonchifolius]
MGSKTNTWSDQWGTGVFDNEEKDYEKQNDKSNNNKKMDQVKAAASTGLVKAKSAAIVGAQKVKKGIDSYIDGLRFERGAGGSNGVGHNAFDVKVAAFSFYKCSGFYTRERKGEGKPSLSSRSGPKEDDGDDDGGGGRYHHHHGWSRTYAIVCC